VRWLIPALAVMVVTASVGALRYPGLPAYIVNGSGRRVSKSAVSVLIAAGQLYFTVAYSGLMLIIHRSRPDIEAADPAASTLRYRRFLAAFTRALPALPFAAGVLMLGAVAARMGRRRVLEGRAALRQPRRSRHRGRRPLRRRLDAQLREPGRLAAPGRVRRLVGRPGGDRGGGGNVAGR
jgi:hypothetical protein